MNITPIIDRVYLQCAPPTYCLNALMTVHTILLVAVPS